MLYIISTSAVEGCLLVHAELATQTKIISMGCSPHEYIATPSAPIAGSAYVLAAMMSMCCHAALLCLWLQPTKAIGLHDGGQR